MAKRKTFSKKSINRLPKGLPIRNKHGTTTPTGTSNGISPFEITQRMKRPKFAVHNRGGAISSSSSSSYQQPKRLSALAESLTKRENAIISTLQQQKKSNQFIDKRIGEAGNTIKNQQQQLLSNDAKNLARLVRERTRQSKRISKYALNDDDDDDDDGRTSRKDVLTHKGTAITDMTDIDHVILSDDDEDNDGNLDAYDTEMHFGGKGITDKKFNSIYGDPSNGTTGNDLSTAYSQKKLDLDDLIIRRKTMKLERIKSRETQVDTFEAMDKSFGELASMLQFRNKEQEIRDAVEAKRNKAPISSEDQEYDDWDREMKQYIHVDKKVAASSRTKTPEEIAKEEADKLHKLETRRLARMNGDFEEEDELSDIDVGDKKRIKWRKLEKRSTKASNNPEQLDYDSDEIGNEKNVDQNTTRFTSEGLVYVNKDGVVIGKVSDITNTINDDDNDDDDDDGGDTSDDDNEDDDHGSYRDNVDIIEYKVGDKVMANYRGKEQFDGHEAWYSGVITDVIDDDGNDTKLYNIEYDDGDFEDDVEPQFIRPNTAPLGMESKHLDLKAKEIELKRKRQLAMEKARYVFACIT
jgi:nucleolar protein 14